MTHHDDSYESVMSNQKEILTIVSQIRSNAVNPTVVLTAMGQVGWSKPEKRDPMLAKIPLGRFCEVDDVVGPVLFLLSGLSAMVNGVTIPVDGGFLAT